VFVGKTRSGVRLGGKAGSGPPNKCFTRVGSCLTHKH
jgi:hypothetical protein